MSIQIEIDHVNEKNRSVQQLPRKSEPEFSQHEPDLEKIIEVKKEREFENLIVVGNGGAITSFRAYLYAFLRESDKNVRIVTTMDPDYLNTLKREMDPEETLVMPISRSGETTGVIEASLYFMDKGYELLPVTPNNEGALRDIVRRKDMDYIEHPEIKGRFSGLTEAALAPAAFAGIDIEEIRKGGEEMYEKLSPENLYNPALNLASAFYDSNEKSYDKIFAPFYSTRLFGFYPLFVQLMHETVCKEGEGQTVFGEIGPEWQHHTAQRLFGGKEDILTVFFKTDAHEYEEVKVPEELEDIDLRGRALGSLNGLELEESLESEYISFKNSMDDRDMPNITINLTDVSHRTLGKLVSLIQYTSVYSAWMRDLDPFKQPEVEMGGEKAFKERFKN